MDAKLTGKYLSEITLKDDGYFVGVIECWDAEFGANESKRIEESVVIVDEFSMVDINLFAALLRALPDDAKLLLMGDPDQLPSIGPGAVLRDLLESGIPCGRLTEILRNDGAIVQACQNIRELKPIANKSVQLEDESHNLCQLETPQHLSQVSDVIRNIFKYECSLPRRDAGKAPVRSEMEFQVILPINTKSPVSRVALNADLQPFFNPNAGESVKPRGGFFVGDKLICLRNGDLDRLSLNDAISLQLAASDEKSRVQYESQSSFVRIANGEIVKVAQLFNNAIVLQREDDFLLIHIDTKPKESRSNLSVHNFELAYCVTCHKAQGSSWPVVVVVLDSSVSAMHVSDRHWLYTAISRAEMRCYLVGDSAQIERLTRVSKMWARKTFLWQTIRELVTVFHKSDRTTALPKFTLAARTEQRKPIASEPKPKPVVTEAVVIPLPKPWRRPGLRHRETVIPSFNPQDTIDGFSESPFKESRYVASVSTAEDPQDYHDSDEMVEDCESIQE